MSYHTIIFAPDALDPNEGPLVQIPERGLPPMGTQSTLPVDEREPILYNSRGMEINVEPKRRPIGFHR